MCLLDSETRSPEPITTLASPKHTLILMKGMMNKLWSISTTITAPLKQGSVVFQINPSSQNLFPIPTRFPESANQPRDEQILSDFHVCCDRDDFGPSTESKEVPPTAEMLLPPPTAPLPAVLQVSKEPEPHDLHFIMESTGTGKDLTEFENRCPPGGRDAVVLYTTSMRGVRKTFEDCRSVRFLLESFRVFYQERDVSMHLEYREELWRVMGGRVVPPRLFVRGRCIGGADEVMALHEQGRLRKLLQGLPLSKSRTCHGCGGAHFVVCPKCSGSRKCASSEQTDDDLLFVRCLECNENGLVKCPVCC